MVFVTSDLHFGHKNIIKYENRPFKDVEEMDQKLIENWNKKVGEYDTVYILGDFSWYKPRKTEEILRKLKGRKILIKGNHDVNFLKKDFDTSLFAGIYDYLEIKENNINYVLFHYPIAEFNEKKHNWVHLYGHIHTMNPELEKELKNSYNVGVDRHNYEPVEIINFLPMFVENLPINSMLFFYNEEE